MQDILRKTTLGSLIFVAARSALGPARLPAGRPKRPEPRSASAAGKRGAQLNAVNTALAAPTALVANPATPLSNHFF